MVTVSIGYISCYTDETNEEKDYALSLLIGDIREGAIVSMHHHYAIMVHTVNCRFGKFHASCMHPYKMCIKY
jgi:hypothetical protein